jgi:hypothetical protein
MSERSSTVGSIAGLSLEESRRSYTFAQEVVIHWNHEKQSLVHRSELAHSAQSIQLPEHCICYRAPFLNRYLR